jgi:hypothetical protein
MDSTERWDDMEQKKWFVNRFEVTMEGLKKALMTSKETFSTYANRIEIGFKEGRTITLAGMALIASVILGIAEQLGISYPYIIGIVLSVIFAGMAMLVLLSILSQRAYSNIRNVNSAFLKAIDELNFLSGQYYSITFELEGTKIERLEFFLYYTQFAGGTVRLPIIDALTKMSKSLLFRGLRSQLSQAIQVGNKHMIDTKKYYYEAEQLFHDYEDDFSELTEIHGTFLERYNIIYPNPQIKTNSNGDPAF